MEPLLETTGITKHFGGIQALNDITFKVRPGQIKAIIGPNGAGKTTLFNCISGVLKADKGDIKLNGQSITGFPPHKRAQAGISRTFQNVAIFPEMTVLENVLVGRHCRSRCEMLQAGFRTRSMRNEEREIVEKAWNFLEFVGLENQTEKRAGELPLGDQRLLEIARALATEPKIVLLDEPAGGLNTKETERLAELIHQIRDSGITVLLVEHDMNLVMDISDEILVINFGERLAEGNPKSIKSNPDVINAYLGEDIDYSDL
ncbi:MAG: high-affinity branched-chain amino acid ABC transporter ATP-binding protein LivG [Deltaproteobacteria bacterium]|nr:MAG: high-affinity branched-chain amino acid ABC transporter ATP-binding protein LivG [Deltaproteobacteria bacterium]